MFSCGRTIPLILLENPLLMPLPKTGPSIVMIVSSLMGPRQVLLEYGDFINSNHLQEDCGDCMNNSPQVQSILYHAHC